MVDAAFSPDGWRRLNVDPHTLPLPSIPRFALASTSFRHCLTPDITVYTANTSQPEDQLPLGRTLYELGFQRTLGPRHKAPEVLLYYLPKGPLPPLIRLHSTLEDPPCHRLMEAISACPLIWDSTSSGVRATIILANDKNVMYRPGVRALDTCPKVEEEDEKEEEEETGKGGVDHSCIDYEYHHSDRVADQSSFNSKQHRSEYLGLNPSQKDIQSVGLNRINATDPLDANLAARVADMLNIL
ncbi:unnamed protein product [Protopolystoma xenopodis]|uniref:Uncharacterized protein n=1 Tax=Protopolystoma xenopodis TaxID=117903 RepID=A0A3S5FFX3_9PLAT|nr:unnamed protein product [Protopolystoma xenopodis]